MSKFQIGDRVEVTNPNETSSIALGAKGKRGVIRARSQAFDWAVLFDGVTITCPFYEEELSLLEPAKFEHNRVTVERSKDGGLNITSPRREQWETGFAHLEGHQAEAVREYFKHMEEQGA